MPKKIIIKGARVHNLKNVDVEIPRDQLVVLSGLSGSGKSSLAFDTLYAEGHRRFVESLSSYARMFLGQMDKPDVDSIEGLSPAISIDQKTTSKNPRSTVGTVTEIYDYLRLLYARIGVPHCPVCGKEGFAINNVKSKRCEGCGFVLYFNAISATVAVIMNEKDEIGSITLIGLCTDICVISNAMLVKAFLPEVPIIVDSACCAGVTPDSHANALSAMSMCQIDIL